MSEMKTLTLNGKTYDSFVDKTARKAIEDLEIPEGGSVELDTSLTQSGKAADAKAVGDKIAEVTGISLVEPAEDDIPKVFFGGALQQTKDEKVVPFRYISKTQDVSGYAEIKAQGNSSMGYPKKNQTVKMFKDADCTEKLKVDFKGWGKQNKHVYKANWIDITHARNVVSARLWGDVVKSRANYADLPELLRTSPNQGAVDGFPVKVYADGVYQGRYTLNIPKDGWMANMDDELDTHCILCGEGYNSGCFREASVSQWTDELHDSMPSAIRTRWIEVINFVMNSSDEEFKAKLGNYFDVPSLIDYHLYGLLSCGLDAYGKNQLYLTYDGQKWFASMYDMDSTWGLYWNGSKVVATDYPRTSYEDYVSSNSSGDGNLLYIRLEQLFWSEMQTRWAELKNGALSIENIINRFERFTDIASDELVKEDYASTTGDGKFTGIPSKNTSTIQQIRAYALARQAWTGEYVASLTPEVQIPCTGISLNANTLTFTAEGSQTLTATVTPDGCTDAVTWESNNASVATVNGGVVTAVANGNATITAKCGNYSASCSVSVSGIVEPVPCTGITLNKTELMFTDVDSQTLTATVTPNDTTDAIVWRSDNESVATVSDGVVTPVSGGTATITAICGAFSATCAVVVEVSINYSIDALETATWKNGYCINGGTGAVETKASHHITEPLVLQNCTYLYTSGDGNTWSGVNIYDKDDNYVGGFERNVTAFYIHAVPEYKYRIQLYSDTDSYANATLLPVDKSASAEYTVLNLAEQTWVTSNNAAETTLDGNLHFLDETNIDQTNVFVLGANGSIVGVVKAVKNPLLFYATKYGDKHLLIAPYFKTAESAAEYFTANNTVLEFNKRNQ